MARILVTGGAGFIGSHICDRLLADGHETLSLDNLSSGVDFTPKDVRRVSLLDVAELGALDAVVHCAAIADIRHNWTEVASGLLGRERLWASNVELTRTLLEVTKQYGCNFVFMSTCAVYGYFTAETAAPRPRSPYAASKLAAEALIESYAWHDQRAWHVLRLSRVVGPRYHHGHIADFVRQAKATGTIKPLNDGREQASCVHVYDVAQLASNMATHPNHYREGVHNLAAGRLSPRDTVEMMGLAGKVNWPHNTLGWVGDVAPLVSSVKLIEQGWLPKYSVEIGVKQAFTHLRWERPQANAQHG